MNQLLLVGILEGFRQLPKDGQPLVGVELSALLAQQEIESSALRVVVEKQGRAEFAFLEIAHLEDAGMIHALENLELARRLPHQRLPGVNGRRQGVAINPDATADTGRNVLSRPVLIILALLNEGAQLIVSDAPVFVGWAHAGFDNGAANHTPQFVTEQRSSGWVIPGALQAGDDPVVVAGVGTTLEKGAGAPVT